MNKKYTQFIFIILTFLPSVSVFADFGNQGDYLAPIVVFVIIFTFLITLIIKGITYKPKPSKSKKIKEE